MMNLLTGPIPRRMKWAVILAGAMLIAPGPMLALGFLCGMPAAIFEGGPQDDLIGMGLFLFMGAVISLGGGFILLRQGSRSLSDKPSPPLWLPSLWHLVVIFGLCWAIGRLVYTGDFLSPLLLPPLLMGMVAAPPLLAVAWFMEGRAAGGLTRRQAWLALVIGAIGGGILALILTFLLSAILYPLTYEIPPKAGYIKNFAINYPYAYYLVLLAPLVEALVKPLPILPLIGRLSRREAFLAGAIAGAGFAVLETPVYLQIVDMDLWSAILLIQAMGGAIHPLTTGLVALGWQGVLAQKRESWTDWFISLGLATGLLALWNGGWLLMTEWLDNIGWSVDLMTTAAGAMLALLLLGLGLIAFWWGRRLAGPEPVGEEKRLLLSDRAIAIWAIACLVTILPVAFIIQQVGGG